MPPSTRAPTWWDSCSSRLRRGTCTTRTPANLAKHVGNRAMKVALTVDADDGILERHRRGAGARHPAAPRRGRAPPCRRDPLALRPARDEGHRRVEPGRRRPGGRLIVSLATGSCSTPSRRRAPTRPGGNGAAFDWSILSKPRPRQALDALGRPDRGEHRPRRSRSPARRGVDVSSSVESSPGVKDPAKIAAFVKAAKAAGEASNAAPRARRVGPAASRPSLTPHR